MKFPSRSSPPAGFLHGEKHRMSDAGQTADLMTLTADIVAAHVARNSVPVEALPELIRSVHRSLLGTSNPPAPVAEKPIPVVPIKKSVFPDYIICLEDGKKLKMLKRHLKTAYGMSPEQYRERWGLPSEYPMVAPNYAERRSSLAKQIGLGTQGRRSAG